MHLSKLSVRRSGSPPVRSPVRLLCPCRQPLYLLTLRLSVFFCPSVSLPGFLTVHFVVGPDTTEVAVAVHAVPHVVDIGARHITVNADRVEQVQVAEVGAKPSHLQKKEQKRAPRHA